MRWEQPWDVGGRVRKLVGCSRGSGSRLVWRAHVGLSPVSGHEWSFPSVSVVKNLPAKQEIWVRSLVREDPLEREMATCSYILAWEIPWTEEPGGLQSMGSQSQTQLSVWAHTCSCRTWTEARVQGPKDGMGWLRSLPDVLRQKPCLPRACESLPETVLPNHLPHLPFMAPCACTPVCPTLWPYAL